MATTQSVAALASNTNTPASDPVPQDPSSQQPSAEEVAVANDASVINPIASEAVNIINPVDPATVNAVNAINPSPVIAPADVSAATAAAAANLVPPIVAANAPGLAGYHPMMFAPQGPQAAVLDAGAGVHEFQEPPTFVNPKQFHRILKRREVRKKQTGSDVISYTPRKRSYMHESRHRHAVARKRGVGGRFLSKKKEEEQRKVEEDKKKSEQELVASGATAGITDPAQSLVDGSGIAASNEDNVGNIDAQNDMLNTESDAAAVADSVTDSLVVPDNAFGKE